jgi:cation:H+ antiporter
MVPAPLAIGIALALVTLGAELLVRGAVVLAHRLRVSPFFIGLTVVGFGTSTPELFTSLIATLRGADDLSVGNVVGSNLFNIAFILGITALLVPIPVRYASVRPQVWWALGAALVPFAALATAGHLSALLGLALLAGLVAYLWTGFREGRRDAEAVAGTPPRDPPGTAGGGAWAQHPAAAALFVAVGLVLLIGGSALLVDGATRLARGVGVSELVIGLTVVAGGTSAPELFTSLVAALRRQHEISVGNILGSNVFNGLGILGLTAVVGGQQVAAQVLRLDAPLLVGLTLALFPILRSGARISRGEGALLLASYLAYLGALFARGPLA